MSRFEFYPITREAFPHEPRPAREPQPSQRFRAATAERASKPDSSQQVEATATDRQSGSDSRVESEDASHQQERKREEQGNRGPEEEDGFGQGA